MVRDCPRPTAMCVISHVTYALSPAVRATNAPGACAGIQKVAAIGYCYGATATLGLEERGAIDVWGICHGAMTAAQAADVKAPGMLQARRGSRWYLHGRQMRWSPTSCSLERHARLHAFVRNSHDTMSAGGRQ